MSDQPLSDAELELLHHHGDQEIGEGLLDFAVNVRAGGPPPWLRTQLASALDTLGSYPTVAADDAARGAVAVRHGRRPDEVLVLAGVAEGFALLPSLRPKLAAVVHPSFTEPEAALREAGVPVHRVMLPAVEGYRLRPDLVPDAADLVVLGNPTNPTSVLHPAEVIHHLIRPGRIVVVDEAFADAVPREPESLAGRDIEGLLVLRSLTKSWSLAGLRAGYALGPPELLKQLSIGRSRWSVGTLVLEAVRACSLPAAVAEIGAAAVELTEHRRFLVDALADISGISVHLPAYASYLLLRVPHGVRVREALRDKGIAVRRGDTFPGLSADHIRVAVRSPEASRVLVRALAEALNELSGFGGARCRRLVP